MIEWIQRTMDVFQRSAGSSEFMPQAAQAVLENVRLDVAAILLREDDQWRIQSVAMDSPVHDPGWKPSLTILDRVFSERRTFRQLPEGDALLAESLQQVRALVAAPILDPEGRVIGAIYGNRRRGHSPTQDISITRIEAKLVQLMACGVAAGLARLNQEKIAIKARVQFEQFFTPELAVELEKNPDLLTGHDSEVSLLIGDLGGFSGISERLAPERTVAWINDVLETFSECVIQEGGVLVDYVGDELFAMWGAPVTHTDHVQRCCRAGQAMQNLVPILNERWKEELKTSFDFGIGIHTGIARVGNIGSRRKFKYGPLGNTVNLTSRVQGATKFLRTRLLITEPIATQLNDQFSTRRLCKAKVKGIQQPLDLFALNCDPSAEWIALRDRYESALDSFEKGDWHHAADILGSVLKLHPNDGPTVLLLSRTANLLLEGDAREFNPVWELPGK